MCIRDSHWSELVGGDLCQTINYKWQQRLNGGCDMPVEDRIGEPVPAEYLAALEKLGEFRKSYDEDGLKPEAVSYTPLRSFSAAPCFAARMKAGRVIEQAAPWLAWNSVVSGKLTAWMPVVRVWLNATPATSAAVIIAPRAAVSSGWS